MVTVKVKFTQFSSRANKEIGFIAEDKSEVMPTILQVKCWATIVLYNWFAKHEIQNIKTFYKSIPIKIEGFINSELQVTLMQKRVTKDTIIKEERDMPFPFPEKLYFLTNYIEPKKQSSETRQNKKNLKNFEREKYLNTIEFFNQNFPRFGSPIIFTGWSS